MVKFRWHHPHRRRQMQRRYAENLYPTATVTRIDDGALADGCMTHAVHPFASAPCTMSSTTLVDVEVY